MPALSVLIKPASSLCNMSCDYCFYCDEAQKRTQNSFGLMSEETLKNVIRKTILRADEMITYVFQGGEPSLRGLGFFEKFIEYEKKYNKNHIHIQNAFQTNGYLIDEKWCKFFKENQFLIGLSVDGTPEIHNALRHDRRTGNNTFDRILHSAHLMDNYGVDYNILTVVTPEIADHISEIYSFYRKNGWKYQQYIACLDPLDEGHRKTPHALTPEIYGRFLIDLFYLWYRDLKKGSQPYIRQFENWAMIAAGYMPESCDQRGFCSIQNVVEADGSVYPCDFYMLDEYKLGNFNQDSLDEINRKRNELQFVERSYKLDHTCKECRYYRICRGGCQRNRDYNVETGLYQNYFCKGYQMFFERYYDTLMEIGENAKSYAELLPSV